MLSGKCHRGRSRRDVLKSLAALGSATKLMALRQDTGNGRPNLSFPTDPRQRLSVTSWPFRAYIQTPTTHARDKSKPGMDLKEFAATVMQRFGVPNINPLADHFSSTEPAYLDAFRTAVEKAGSHVVDLGLSGKSFYDTDSSVRDAAVDYGRKWIDIAKVIGSPSVRQHIHAPANMPRDVDRAAESLGQVADYGAKRNIIVNLENDSPVTEDPFFLVSILQKVKNPYLRGLPDMGNSIVGHDQKYNERAVDAMFKYAYNMCHVKDVITTEKGKVYRVDLAKTFKIAKANEYRGYYSMEYDTSSGDPFEGTQKLVNDSLKYLA
jgi:sugar phosphate isomerase/epimerase